MTENSREFSLKYLGIWESGALLYVNKEKSNSESLFIVLILLSDVLELVWFSASYDESLESRSLRSVIGDFYRGLRALTVYPAGRCHLKIRFNNSWPTKTSVSFLFACYLPCDQISRAPYMYRPTYFQPSPVQGKEGGMCVKAIS